MLHVFVYHPAFTQFVYSAMCRIHVCFYLPEVSLRMQNVKKSVD